MASNFDALRLADWLDDLDNESGPVPGAARELRRQHSRIEADEALIEQAAEALEAAKFVLDAAIGMHLVHVPDDADGPVVQIPAAITAMRKRLESSK